MSTGAGSSVVSCAKVRNPIGSNTRSGSPAGPRRPASAFTDPVRSAAEDPVIVTVSARNRASLSRSHLIRSGQPSVMPVISSMNQNRRPPLGVNGCAAWTRPPRSPARQPSTEACRMRLGSAPPAIRVSMARLTSTDLPTRRGPRSTYSPPGARSSSTPVE